MPKVLVVDDDPAMLTLMTRILEDAGFKPTGVKSGQAAIEALCRATVNGVQYDAILLDIAMPQINGWRVLDAIRSNPLWRDIRVVVLSGYSQSPQALSRIAQHDGVFVEKKNDFDGIVVDLLRRLVAQPATP